MTSTISFPSSPQNHSEQNAKNISTLTTLPNSSNVSVHATALEVCQSVYGDVASSDDSMRRFYESSAVYENPLITTTSREMLADIHHLSRRFSVVDVPRPIAVFYSLFRLKLPDHLASPLFRAVRAWTEIGDVSETESFDGHRKTMVEHTLNILIFPDIHTDSGTARFNQSTESLISTMSPMSSAHPYHPSLPVPGTSLTVPSPFHLQLHIITRLAFNEQGRITHHRDFWDVKDVLGLVPGVSLAQWIGTRVTARGLVCVARYLIRSKAIVADNLPGIQDLEIGVTQAVASDKKPLELS